MKKSISPLIPIDINNIALNENAYFYKLLKPLDKNDIFQIFTEAREDKNGLKAYESLIKVPLFEGGKNIGYYSLDIFHFFKKPTFFKNPVPGKFELKYAFYLIVEYKDYACILKKNISGTEKISKHIEKIDYKILAHYLISNKTKIEKIISNSINTAQNAIQRKTSEANDLQNVMSRFGISKQILSSLRIDNNGHKHTVSLNTSRINSFKLQADFEQVKNWIIDNLKLINIALHKLPESEFIKGFAEPIDFRSKIDELTPTYILLRFGPLKGEIESNSINRCYSIINGMETNVDLLKIINDNQKLYSIKYTKENLYESDDGNVRLKINEKSISIQIAEFKDIILEYNEDYSINLNQYINNGSHFIVNFDKIDFVYTNSKIFRDTKLLNDTDNFFQAFIPYDELKNIDSEKGKNYTAKTTEFDPLSLFGFIENKLTSNATCLICDDMGTEWADFISINNDEVSFYHAKFNKKGLSATNLEEVFGQAQKNLGYLELNNTQIDYRKDKWEKPYVNDGIVTQIDRIRKCPDSLFHRIDEIKKQAESASSNPNVTRKVFVVINFLSKKEVQNAVEEVKKGKDFHNKGVTLQILWFVNALLSTAHDLTAQFKIICQP